MMKKKALSLAALLFAVLIISSFTACGRASSSPGPAPSPSPEYPELTDVHIPNHMLTKTFDGITASYQPKKWFFDNTNGVFAIYYIATLENAVNDNVTVTVRDERCDMDESYIEKVTDEFNEDAVYGEKLGAIGLMSFENSTVLYCESTLTMTDEFIDECLEDGTITEGFIETEGGRDALENKPLCSEVQLHADVDGRTVVVTGVYSDEANKKAVLHAAKLILKTIKLS